MGQGRVLGSRILRGLSQKGVRLSSWLLVMWYRACYPGLKIGAGVLVRGGTRIRVLNGAKLTIGDRCVIDRNCLLVSENSLSIGPDSYLGGGCVIVAAGSIDIGADALIAANVTIRDQDHQIAQALPYRLQGLQISPIYIQSNVWIGVNAVVLKGVRIGEGGVVGAGSVVTKDVLPRCVVAGVPARLLRVIQAPP